MTSHKKPTPANLPTLSGWNLLLAGLFLFACAVAVWLYLTAHDRLLALNTASEKNLQLQSKLENSRNRENLLSDDLKKTEKALVEFRHLQIRQDHSVVITQELQQSQSENLELRKELEKVNQQASELENALYIAQQQLDQNQNLLTDAISVAEPSISADKIDHELLKLKASLAQSHGRVKLLKNRFTVIELNNEILFKNGEGTLKPGGQKILDQVAAVLKNYPQRKIAIQGHTDNLPITGELKNKYHSNWTLSAVRAASAIHYLQHHNHIAPERMILVGYSKYQPVADNSLEDGRKRNRRIEIMLLPEHFTFFQAAQEIEP